VRRKTTLSIEVLIGKTLALLRPGKGCPSGQYDGATYRRACQTNRLRHTYEKYNRTETDEGRLVEEPWMDVCTRLKEDQSDGKISQDDEWVVDKYDGWDGLGIPISLPHVPSLVNRHSQDAVDRRWKPSVLVAPEFVVFIVDLNTRLIVSPRYSHLFSARDGHALCQPRHKRWDYRKSSARARFFPLGSSEAGMPLAAQAEYFAAYARCSSGSKLGSAYLRSVGFLKAGLVCDFTPSGNFGLEPRAMIWGCACPGAAGTNDGGGPEPAEDEAGTKLGGGPPIPGFGVGPAGVGENPGGIGVPAGRKFGGGGKGEPAGGPPAPLPGVR